MFGEAERAATQALRHEGLDLDEDPEKRVEKTTRLYAELGLC